MGIDIEPGCGGRKRCYSVVLVENGRVISKYESVSLQRLVRLILEHKPDILAIDNIYELAPGERELAKLVSLLPPSLEIVQVTRSDEGYVDLRRLASSLGINVGQGKLSPMKTAYLVALLAEKGVGTRVRFVESKTKIIVAKNRSLSSGGMSSNRYKRRVRAAILRAVKDIKKMLDRYRFDYDLVFRKSGGGLEGAVFIVYAHREKLYGIIKPYEDNDVRIEIKPVYSSRIVFEKSSRQTTNTGSRRYVIVGVDPGIATGIAILDLNGSIVAVASRKGMDRQEIVELVRRHGIPVLVATDTRPAPEFAKKLAGVLGVPLYEPPETLSVEEKRELVSRYAGNMRLDSHTRDALAAALKAYHSFLGKMRQVEANMVKLGIDVDIERIKAEVIRGKSVAEAVENEIERLLSGDEGILFRSVRHARETSEQTTIQQCDEDLLSRLRSEIEQLRAENINLRNKIRELTIHVERIRNDYEILRREINERVEIDRTVSLLRHELNLVRNELDKLYRENEQLKNNVTRLRSLLLALVRGELILAISFSSLSEKTLKQLKSGIVKYIVVENIGSLTTTVLAKLKELKINAILAPRNIVDKIYGEAEAREIPVLALEDYLVDRVDDMVFLKPEVVVDAYSVLAEIKRKRLNENRRILDKDKLRALLEEYRKWRIREALGGEAETQ